MIDKVLKPTARVMTNNMAANTAVKLRDNVQKAIYNTPDPKFYRRTREVLKAITYEKPQTIYSGRIYQTKVVFDYSKINPAKATVPGYWNRHMGMSEQKFNDGRLISVLNSGTRGMRSLYEREPTYFIEETKKWLEQQVGPNANISFVQTRVSDHINPETDNEMWPVGIRIRRRR